MHLCAVKACDAAYFVLVSIAVLADPTASKVICCSPSMHVTCRAHKSTCKNRAVPQLNKGLQEHKNFMSAPRSWWVRPVWWGLVGLSGYYTADAAKRCNHVSHAPQASTHQLHLRSTYQQLFS